MLVLLRVVGETVMIGDGIVVKVLDVRNGEVRLGIEAPRDVPVHRQEIAERIAAGAGERISAPAGQSGGQSVQVLSISASQAANL